MRMWMVNPRIMCRQHLLGEHVEMHMFEGSIRKGVSMAGYVSNDLLEVTHLTERHDELVEEMERRGFNHKSPIQAVDVGQLTDYEVSHTIDQDNAFQELMHRCPACQERYNLISQGIDPDNQEGK